MKKGFYILLIMFAAVWVVSCDKTKSYTDMLKDQEKAIAKLERDSGFVFLSDFPKDSIFKWNEFVELDNGVYLNIINKGTKERAVLGETTILCRFKVRLFMGSDTGIYANSLIPPLIYNHPEKFKYGSVQGIETTPYSNLNCAGLQSALEYVGDSSRVRLIVPFKQASSDFQSAGMPLFFEEVSFVFY